MTNEKFVFDEDTHTYRLGDRVIPGHTRVLDMGGLVPYGAIAPDILERKSAIGRAVHFACFLHDEGKPFTSDPHIRGYIDAWIDFRKQTGFTPSLREHRDLYCFNGLPFGMQIDALGKFPGLHVQEAVVEIKTCSTILPHHGVQLAAQAAGVEAKDRKGSALDSYQARFFVRARYVCQLFETGRWKLHQFKQAADLETFEHALALTYWKLEHEHVYRVMEEANA